MKLLVFLLAPYCYLLCQKPEPPHQFEFQYEFPIGMNKVSIQSNPIQSIYPAIHLLSVCTKPYFWELISKSKINFDPKFLCLKRLCCLFAPIKP